MKRGTISVYLHTDVITTRFRPLVVAYEGVARRLYIQYKYMLEPALQIADTRIIIRIIRTRETWCVYYI